MKNRLANRNCSQVASNTSNQAAETQGKKVEIVSLSGSVTVGLVSDKKRVEIVEGSIASALATMCLLESSRKEKKHVGARYSLSDKVLEDAFVNSFTASIQI